MKEFLGVILASSFIVLLGNNAIGQVAVYPYSPGLSHYLEPAEVEELRAFALHGDADAARKLSDFYYLSESDPEDGVFWLRVSAENGHCGSQVRLAQDYRHRLDLSDANVRSTAWLEVVDRNPSCKNNIAPK